MFEGAVAGILNRLLGKYVQDLDTEHLNVGIFSGNVNLSDLKLKPEALYELDLPIDVKIGTIGRINLQIPWSGLYTQPVVINIEDVLVLVGPAISNSYFDAEREKRLTRAAKRKILQDLEAESEILKGPQNFFENLFTAIVNNLQIYIRNVHVRYEDSISSKDGPLACGLCLQSLAIETTNSKWKPSVTPLNAVTVYQMMRIESLSLYWNPTATALDDTETAQITPMQYYNWKHYMLTGLDKFSMHHEDFEFLLKPVTCKVKVIINRSGEARVPRLLLDAVLQDSALQLSRRQHLSIDNLLGSFRRITLNRKYRHLYPGVPISKNIKKWWKYAYNVVVDQRVRPYTWAAIKKHRENYNVYKNTYKSTLRSPNDTELKLDLQKCEDNLPIISVVIAREQAKFELLAQEPERIEVVETEFDWWKPTSSDCESEIDESKARVELCVKAERSRSLWSHLSSPEKKRVCELIGYVEGSPKQDKSKQYIEHKINLTLANCSVTLMNRSKEVLVVTLTQFLASLETRPSAKAYKLSARAESIVIEGVSSDGDLLPLLTVEKGLPTATNLLAVDFEKNPMNSEADYGISWLMEPVEFLYVEHAFTELINFFQTHSMTVEDLAEELSLAVDKAGAASRSVLAYAISRRKVFQVNADVKGPCIVIPEHGCVQKAGRVMILDISRIIVKSDLQPSNLVLEDATCMELEEKLYDRLHAECSCQVLFCDWTEPWRESRRHADSELHLVPRIKSQLVFSSSIKKDYKLLPRYKLNISLSSLKLNLSDRIIGYLLDFCDNLPIPVPNTVPVSFMDSGDFAEDPEDPMLEELALDRVAADPGYAELIELRQKIVAAYLRRNRTPETELDGAGAQSPAEAPPAAELSDEEVEVYARSVDLPGFDDNVSPSNTIGTLLRFVIGEIVINLSRSREQTDLPYLMLSVGKVCLDVALMEYGPAAQLAVGRALLTDKRHHSSSGQYLELITSSGELLNLLYRKVRADCPEFKSHFHSVEHALVADTGPVSLLLHADALRTLFKYLQYMRDKIQNRHALNLQNIVVPRAQTLWDFVMKPDADPPVPPGATKFSYSVRASSITMRLCHLDCALVEVRLAALESDCVFRANDRMIFKMYLGSLQVDDLSESTLYPKLIWPDEDKVIEIKYVRSAVGIHARAHAELRVYVGRLHVVLFCCLMTHLQQFLEPLVPGAAAAEAAAAAERAAHRRLAALKATPARVNLAIEIHAPVLLLPQKPSSPNLLVLNMGDLMIENFFKPVQGQEAGGPVIDNVLMKLVNITLSRAVMTLAGTLEVQEPILEPMAVRCDMKRAVCYQQLATTARNLLLCDADVVVDTVMINLGQKDLATVLAVYSDNLSEGNYIGSIIPSSPVELAPSDAMVKKLQAFFAQGDPVRKESVIRLTLEGVELKLFSDMDEVLSSPVREPSRGLARLCAGEAALVAERYSDGSAELRGSLRGLLLEDIRPDPAVLIKRIFQSQGGGSRAAGGISVSRPPLLDASVRYSAAGAATADVRLDRTRLNLALPFLLQLARTLLDAMPGEKTLDGGVVNHGYVGDGARPACRPARFPSSSDSTSGYYSTATSVPEETPSISISVQCRQPEIMFFTDHAKSEGHALLLRTELLIDYSRHSNTENLVVSFAGLQVMSKLQSKLKNLPPQLVLRPCDVEFSKSFKNVEEGIKVRFSVSEIDIHVAATTVHTIMDIVEEVTSELAVPDEKETFNFSTFNLKQEKAEEDLWAPKKLTPLVPYSIDDPYIQPKYPSVMPTETFTVNIPSVRVMFEIEQTVRVPVLVLKLSAEMQLHDWSKQLHGGGSLSILASVFNEKVDSWEPLIEPVVEDNVQRPWEITATVFQAKSYPMSSRLETDIQEETMSDHVSTKTSKKRSEFEAETSADENDTDNEMIFIKNPYNENKHYGFRFKPSYMPFMKALYADDSDGEQEDILVERTTNAMGHLFSESESEPDGDVSDDEDYSSASQQSAEEEEREDDNEEDKPVTYIDGEKKDVEHKNVTLQEPSREASVESCEPEGRLCTYLALSARNALNVTFAPAGARALLALSEALVDRTALVSAIVAAESPLQLVNDIGPGSTVHLRTRSETDLAGHDRVIAIADYDVDISRPSTPGCDTSGADVLEVKKSKKQESTDVTDEWDCFEGGFSENAESSTEARTSPGAPAGAAALRARLTDLTLAVRLHDLNQLTILCPTRSVSKLHVLHPSKNGTRYYIVVERTSKYNNKKIVVRSPLQVRNETSYALELLYRQSELEAAGAEPVGAVRNPFCGLLRLAVLAPHDTYNVPLYVAYHCKLYLLPTNFENYQVATQGIWWMELANNMNVPRDVICPAKSEGDPTVFAMRVLPVEGVKSPKVSRSIPNLLLRVLPPLGVHNRLPHAIQLTGAAVGVRVEPGERAHVYTMRPGHCHRLTLDMQYLGVPWTGSFRFSLDMTEKTINMRTECDTEGGGKRLAVLARAQCGAAARLLLYAPCWLINKTGLPLQIKGRSDVCHELSDEPLLWCPERGADERLRVRVHAAGWSRACYVRAAAPGLLVCANPERRVNYRMLLDVTLSELCPELTKIVTLLPYFLVYNDTKKHLRFMEENEAADLWIDLAPQQCTPFWPQTDSMSMHCKLRDSTLVSQHFPIARNHCTVLRMDKGVRLKKHLRFMEENEAADLWIDLAPQQCTPFWPQTDSMSMHCKLRDSTLVSQHFPIARNHCTVLRMDKGVRLKKHLRFMEENEAADLWIDLAPQQCTPFWPQTDSMSMHCKLRDSTLVSQHFPIARNHCTVLRMDKGSAICVEVTGGTVQPFTITFKPCAAGDAPVRIDNLCDDLFLKLHQAESGQVALLSPLQSMLYTWDDPAKERKLIWNLYNNKGKGFVADFSADGFGEEKVTFHSVKHSTLVATSSVTSKLSSTLKRLTPKSPEAQSSSSDDTDSSDVTERRRKRMRKDKVIVYWISFMDGYQRVFALAQDERIAAQYRARINAERCNYEVYMSLASVGVSVCVPTNSGLKELSYISITDSLPRWEINVSDKWKKLAPDVTAWTEEKYQTEQKKCQVKEYIEIDFEKMQMTKPFFSELRRTYNPGVWMQLRKSDTHTYYHLKLHRFQIDNQLHDAVFPSVLYPAPSPPHTKSKFIKPSIEIVALKQYRPSLNQDVYRYLKILVQAYCVNLDRGFVNYVFEILNHWKVKEKPAIRLRADLALVHMPLPVIAMKSQTSPQKNVVFDFVHLSPIKLTLSMSSKGYGPENTRLENTGKARFGNQKENRPKLFNSDLLEYLFNSWASTLCDMRDVVIRMGYLELRNAPITVPALVETASRHYWVQLVQQFYVLVLGLNILGNPYSYIGDFSKGLKQYYEPCLGKACPLQDSDASKQLVQGAYRLLGCSSDSSQPSIFEDALRLRPAKRRTGEEGTVIDDLPAVLLADHKTSATGVVLAVTGLMAKSDFDDDYPLIKHVCCRAALAACSQQLGAGGAEAALRGCVEDKGARVMARRRLPRHTAPAEGLRPYNAYAARGAVLLAQLRRGLYAETDGYVAHAHISAATTLLVSTRHIFLIRSTGDFGAWHVEWQAALDDLIGPPQARGDQLVFNIKQDELVNYFSTDEKVVEVPEPEVLAWLRSKIECALLHTLEDKRCEDAAETTD